MMLMMGFKRILYRATRKIYHRRVFFTMLCFYSFTLVVLLEFHLKYTKQQFLNSLDFVSRMSRSVKSVPDMMTPKDNNISSDCSAKSNMKAGAFGDEGDKIASSKQRVTYHRNHKDVPVIENIIFPTKMIVAQDEKWQRVTSDGKLYVFSAFFDILEGRPTVRILGINGNMYLPKPYCQFQFDKGEVMTVKGKVWMLPDHHEKEFRTIFFLCGTPDDRRPIAVSVISQKQPELLNALKVVYNEIELRMFTACLSPLHFNVSKHYEFIQWFELNRILGVDYFLVYNYSTVEQTDDVLIHYAKEGWIKIIQWDIPKTDLYYRGQMAMINDCLFRNRKISRFIINTDIDEYIVPRRGLTTLGELMKELPPNCCEYNFRSSFLVSKPNENFSEKETAKELHLDVLLKLFRRQYIFPQNVRSKYIANTSCIDTAGVHFNWKYKISDIEYQKYHVLPQDALVFHYRESPLAKDGLEVDEKAMIKFQAQLIENVLKRWQKINNERTINLKLLH